MAKNYTAITPDDTVYTIEEVQVGETEDVVDEATLTLPYLDTQIAVKTTQIANLQAEITELQATRAAVNTEAETVVLKNEPEPIEELPTI